MILVHLILGFCILAILGFAVPLFQMMFMIAKDLLKSMWTNHKIKKEWEKKRRWKQ